MFATLFPLAKIVLIKISRMANDLFDCVQAWSLNSWKFDIFVPYKLLSGKRQLFTSSDHSTIPNFDAK